MAAPELEAEDDAEGPELLLATVGVAVVVGVAGAVEAEVDGGSLEDRGCVVASADGEVMVDNGGNGFVAKDEDKPMLT